MKVPVNRMITIDNDPYRFQKTSESRPCVVARLRSSPVYPSYLFAPNQRTQDPFLLLADIILCDSADVKSVEYVFDHRR